MLRIFSTVVIFLALDAVWLSTLGAKLYKNDFNHLLRSVNGQLQPNWFAALVVYFALILGLLIFVIPKANHQPFSALGYGLIYGFITYATFDFTNLAVLQDWTLKTSIIDTLWGMFLCGITSYITVLITR